MSRLRLHATLWILLGPAALAAAPTLRYGVQVESTLRLLIALTCIASGRVE